MTDEQVVQAAQDARRESHGTDFLPLHLQQVAVVGCVFRDDQGFRVKTLGQADDPEPVLLAGFFKTIERYTPRLLSWNGSGFDLPVLHRSEEHTSELQSLMRISYAVFCLKKKKKRTQHNT